MDDGRVIRGAVEGSGYFDLRLFAIIPHAGFGLGVERVLQWIVKGEHIRDMIPSRAR